MPHTMHNATEEDAEAHSNQLRRERKAQAEAEAVTAPRVATFQEFQESGEAFRPHHDRILAREIAPDLDPVRDTMGVKAAGTVESRRVKSIAAGKATIEESETQELVDRMELRNEILAIPYSERACVELRAQLDAEFLALPVGQFGDAIGLVTRRSVRNGGHLGAMALTDHYGFCPDCGRKPGACSHCEGEEIGECSECDGTGACQTCRRNRS